MTVSSSSNQGLGWELERESGNDKDSRYDFSKIRTSVRIPNLIEVQRESYDRFLQMDLLPPERDNTGLQAVFRSTFPISDFRDTATLEFVEYRIGNWQCKCGQLRRPPPSARELPQLRLSDQGQSSLFRRRRLPAMRHL